MNKTWTNMKKTWKKHPRVIQLDHVTRGQQKVCRALPAANFPSTPAASARLELRTSISWGIGSAAHQTVPQMQTMHQVLFAFVWRWVATHFFGGYNKIRMVNIIPKAGAKQGLTRSRNSSYELQSSYLGNNVSLNYPVLAPSWVLYICTSKWYLSKASCRSLSCLAIHNFLRWIMVVCSGSAERKHRIWRGWFQTCLHPSIIDVFFAYGWLYLLEMKQSTNWKV